MGKGTRLFRESTMDKLTSVNGPLCSEMNPRVQGCLKSKREQHRKQVELMFKDRNMVINRVTKSQAVVYRNMLKVHKQKKILELEHYKRNQEAASFASSKTISDSDKTSTVLSLKDVDYLSNQRCSIPSLQQDSTQSEIEVIHPEQPLPQIQGSPTQSAHDLTEDLTQDTGDLPGTGTSKYSTKAQVRSLTLPDLAESNGSSAKKPPQLVREKSLAMTSKAYLDRPKDPGGTGSVLQGTTECQVNKASSTWPGPWPRGATSISEFQTSKRPSGRHASGHHTSGHQSGVTQPLARYPSSYSPSAHQLPISQQPTHSKRHPFNQSPTAYQPAPHHPPDPLSHPHPPGRHSSAHAPAQQPPGHSPCVHNPSERLRSGYRLPEYTLGPRRMSYQDIARQRAAQRQAGAKETLDKEPVTEYKMDAKGNVIADDKKYQRQTFQPPSLRDKQQKQKLLETEMSATIRHKEKAERFFERLDNEDEERARAARRRRELAKMAARKAAKDAERKTERSSSNIGVPLSELVAVFQQSDMLADGVDPNSMEALQICKYVRRYQPLLMSKEERRNARGNKLSSWDHAR